MVSICVTAAAAESDTVRVLKTVEVLGVKQMPSPGASPVTRIGAPTVNRLGIDAVKELGEIVPNLYTPQYGSRLTSSIYMRGLGSRIDQAVVGLNVDGVPFVSKDIYDTDIADIDYIEVIRGAQNVLNGRNTMAGQINVYTLSPRDFQGVTAKLDYGRENTVKVSLADYLKLSEKLYTSIGGTYTHTDGFWINDFNGRKVGSENAGSLRWKTVFQPSRHHSITNTATFNMGGQSGYPYALLKTGRIAYNDTCFYRRKSFTDGLTVAWRGRRVVVTSITSLQYLSDNMTLDQDFTPDDYFTLTQRRRDIAFTQDLFTKGVRGSYSWLGGVFGFARSSEMDAPVTLYDTGITRLVEQKRNEMNPSYPITWDSREFPLYTHFNNSAAGVAIYHESQLDLGPWTFEGAVRLDAEMTACDYHSWANTSYTVWHVTPSGERELYKIQPVDIDDKGNLRKTYVRLLPKITATYTHDAGRVYASIGEGYKSGGYNTQMFSDILQQRIMQTMGLSMPYKVSEIVTYKPEWSINYEIGSNATLAGGKIITDLTAFLIDCRDQQLTVFPPGLVSGRAMTNAGRTRSLGVEAALKLRPIRDLAFTANYGYTKATFLKYNNGRADLRGKRVPYAPAHTLFLSVLWTLPVSPAGCEISAEATMRGVGDIYWDDANTARQPFYALPGANLTIAKSEWSLRLWGENLSDTRYNVFYFKSMGNEFAQRGNPFTFGATLSLKIKK